MCSMAFQCPQNHANLPIIVDFYSIFNRLHLTRQIYACLGTDHNVFVWIRIIGSSELCAVLVNNSRTALTYFNFNAILSSLDNLLHDMGCSYHAFSHS